MDNELLISSIISLNKYSKKIFDSKMNIIANKYDLEISDVYTIFFISKNKDVNKACDIVKKHGVSKAYVSKAINSLLEKKYIIIQNSDTDKRIQNIILTDKSIDIVNDINNSLKDSEMILEKNLTNKELNEFKNIINKIILNSKECMEDIK